MADLVMRRLGLLSCLGLVLLLILSASAVRASKLVNSLVYVQLLDETTGEPIAEGTRFCYHDNFLFSANEPDSICCKTVDGNGCSGLLSRIELVDAPIVPWPLCIEYCIEVPEYYPATGYLTDYAITYPMLCGSDTCYMCSWMLLDLRLHPATSAVRDQNLAKPTELNLNQNYPNPFNASTQISFSLPSSQSVRVDIVNVLGERVVTLADGFFRAGDHTLIWDGRNRHAEEAPSGVYFYRIQAEQQSISRKMLLLK